MVRWWNWKQFDGLLRMLVTVDREIFNTGSSPVLTTKNNNMEAIIKFNLEDVDDRMNHLRCVKAIDMALALWQISNLRSKLERIEEVGTITSDDVMNLILEIYDDYEINMNELTN